MWLLLSCRRRIRVIFAILQMRLALKNRAKSTDMLQISLDRGSEITSPLLNDRAVTYRLINRIIDLHSELAVSLDKLSCFR